MMKHSPVAPVLASALVAALALSACSGASSDNSASDGRPVVTVQAAIAMRLKPMSDLEVGRRTLRLHVDAASWLETAASFRGSAKERCSGSRRCCRLDHCALIRAIWQSLAFCSWTHS